VCARARVFVCVCVHSDTFTGLSGNTGLSGTFSRVCVCARARARLWSKAGLKP